jgi:hypothetical protein
MSKDCLDIHSLDYEYWNHLIPARVKIISATGRGHSWYKTEIGNIFDVYKNNFDDSWPMDGFWLRHQIDNPPVYCMYFIGPNDCEVLDAN